MQEFIHLLKLTANLFILDLYFVYLAPSGFLKGPINESYFRPGLYIDGSLYFYHL